MPCCLSRKVFGPWVPTPNLTCNKVVVKVCVQKIMNCIYPNHSYQYNISHYFPCERPHSTAIHVGCLLTVPFPNLCFQSGFFPIQPFRRYSNDTLQAIHGQLDQRSQFYRYLLNVSWKYRSTLCLTQTGNNMRPKGEVLQTDNSMSPNTKTSFS